MTAAPGGIAVVNLSTLVSQAGARAMVDAVARQVREHFAPAWSRLPCPPVLFDSLASVPRGMARLLLVDDSDEPGALGYHTETSGGLVAARPVLAAGGTVLGPGSMSVSCVLSHEVLETHVDPYVNAWLDDAASGRSWALEVCDPVQDGAYEIDGVSVSNFVLPSFFNTNGGQLGSAQVDQMGVLGWPFQITPGGYAVVREANGKVSQLGARRPVWKGCGGRSAMRAIARRAA